MMAARMPMQVCRPAPVSASPPMALVGGPSGEPGMLMAPAMAWGGGAAGRAVHPHAPRHGLGDPLEALVVLVGAPAGEALHGGGNDARVQALERLVAAPEPVHDTPPHILHHHVRLLHQLLAHV